MKRRGRGGSSDNGFEAWGGYMAAKKSKLLEQFTKDASKEGDKRPDQIFQGIAVFVNGYTIPSADEIKRIMMVQGGTYHQYYSTEKTTFIIASNLADAKIKQLKGQPKIVKPNWITDCLAAGKLLNYRQYLLYSNQSKSQPKISFPNADSFETTKQIPSTSKFVELDIEHNKTEDNLKSTKIIETDEVNKDYSASYMQPKVVLESLQPLEMKKHLSEILSTSTATNSETEKIVEENSDSNSSVDLFQHEITIVSNSSEKSKSPNSPLKTNEPSPSKSAHSGKTNTMSTEPKPSTSRIPRAGEANFLSEFYNHSRLHHISTMGSMFKKYVSDLRKNHSGKFPGREQLLAWRAQQKELSSSEDEWHGDGNEKIFMHIDMDCFFVSVGLRNRPELRGLPVAVTHAKGNPQSSRSGASRAAEIECYRKRMENKLNKNAVAETPAPLKEWMTDTAEEPSSMSEIASCSYEARKAGLKNGMFLGAALKRCPNLKTIPYDFEGYKEVSFTLYNTVASFTLNIEAVSCDEMFVDCTEVLGETNTSPLQFATFLRSEIKRKTGCPASTGFGGNILLARLATRKAKPDGQFYLLPENVQNFMQDISVNDLPGVGRNLSLRMQSLHIKTCSDLQQLTMSQLQSEFGQKTGQALYQHCRGQDTRSLDLEHQRKSVSAEINYGIRFEQRQEATAFISELAHEVQNRLQEIGSKGRCITLKLMVKAKNAPTETAKFMGHGVCDSLSRSCTLAIETSDAAIIAREAVKLLDQLSVSPSHLRGMGIQVSKLTQKTSSSAAGSLNQFIVRGKSSVTKNIQEAVEDKTNRSVSPISENSTEDLDPDFLAALPEDIRAEVIQEHTRSKQLKQPQETRPVTRPKSPKAKHSQSSILSDISYSQIDTSFLDALPDDVRNELKNDLQKNRPTNQPQPSGSPSPTKRKTRNSPKKGKMGPKAKQLLKGQSKINSIMRNSSSENDTVPLRIEQEPEPEPTSTSIEEVPEADEGFGVLTVRMPVEKLLPLVREWVDSESSPQPVDGELMGNFLQHLVKNHRIDKVSAVLRTMHRKVESKQSSNWQPIYLEIVRKVQLIMMEEYKAKLHVITEFN